jgi:hypothetical protein
MTKSKKTKDPLSVLLGGEMMVRLLRFVLSNPDHVLALPTLATRLKCKIPELRKLVKTLISIECVRERQTYITTESARGRISKKRVPGIVYNQSFSYGQSLGQLLQDSITLRSSEIPGRLAPAGRPDAIIATGFFTNTSTAVDLLIVGNKVDPKKFAQLLAGIESDLGREIRYALMSTDDFLYRLNMYDQFLRSILDFPHEKLLIRIDHADFR